MFLYCSKLKTIYASDLWNVTNTTNSAYMFSGCSSIVGGTNNSVTFDSSKIDKTMANYTTGYLTYKG